MLPGTTGVPSGIAHAPRKTHKSSTEIRKISQMSDNNIFEPFWLSCSDLWPSPASPPPPARRGSSRRWPGGRRAAGCSGPPGCGSCPPSRPAPGSPCPAAAPPGGHNKAAVVQKGDGGRPVVPSYVFHRSTRDQRSEEIYFKGLSCEIYRG